MYFSFVRIWLVSTNKSITRGKYGHFKAPNFIIFSSLSGHTKLVLGNRCLKALWCLNICVWCCTTYMCEEKFYKPSRCKGGGGAEDWFTEGQSPNYDSARFTKLCNINEIQRFAKIPETACD